jgi:hypothetical protein
MFWIVVVVVVVVVHSFERYMVVSRFESIPAALFSRREYYASNLCSS